MAYRIPNLDRAVMEFQGLNLNCGQYCMEAALAWKHGSKYGKDVTTIHDPLGPGDYTATYGATRTDHGNGGADAHRGIGFDPGTYDNHYGLKDLPKPTTAAAWEQALQTYGPLIAAGHVGAVRIIPIDAAGHYILVVGVTATSEIEYLDPLRPWHSGGIQMIANALGRGRFEPTKLFFPDFDRLTGTHSIYVMRA